MSGENANKEISRTYLSPIFVIKSKIAKSLIWICKSYLSCYEG